VLDATSLPFLCLTTTGRRSGLLREIEIWFTEREGHYYLIAEHRERARWVRNIQAQSRVRARVGERRFEGTARLVNDASGQSFPGPSRRCPTRSTAGATA
jgi:deazaflavin-dependent oxidoreductase (nitroreductase family)